MGGGWMTFLPPLSPPPQRVVVWLLREAETEEVRRERPVAILPTKGEGEEEEEEEDGGGGGCSVEVEEEERGVEEEEGSAAFSLDSPSSSSSSSSLLLRGGGCCCWRSASFSILPVAPAAAVEGVLVSSSFLLSWEEEEG